MTSRLVTGVFGAMLVALAVVILVVVDPEWQWRARAVSLVLGLLGLDAMIAAWRGTTAMLSRIGPLP